MNFTCGGGSSRVLRRSIKGGGAEHVHFVDDVDLEAALGRSKTAVFAEVADLIDAVVGSAVDLDDVHAGTVHDGAGDFGIVVGCDTGATFGVECFGKRRSGTGLAGAARPNKKVGVRDTIGLDGVAQGADDMILPDELVELFGSPAPGDDLVAVIHP